jgi:hypothetical protein
MKGHGMDKITSPLYLLTTQAKCWKCGNEQSVIGLMAQSHEWVEQADGSSRYESYMALLSDITSMPDDVLRILQEHRKGYERRYSHTAGFRYFTNTCECGAFFGDFYLYAEPDGAFFPINEEEASKITYQRLTFDGELDIDCECSYGIADEILKHGKELKS